MITFELSPYSVLKEEIKPLLNLHWEEIALDKNTIELDPNWDEYDAMAARGELHLLTARSGNELIGYYVGIVKPHLHYKNSLTAYNDIIYIKPEHRLGMTGVKLFKEIERTLKERGVQRMYMNTKEHLNFGVILERLGYNKAESIYTKRI
jgi:GNAT superfamily N-acetyltransferase